MKAAVVEAAGQIPVYKDFAEPKAEGGKHVVSVLAAPLSHITKLRASGSHYSSSGNYPFVAGLDGVGRLQNGQRVYFIFPEAPFGSMAEKSLVQDANCIPLPHELDDATAAAIAIPGMSSWAAFKERAKLVAGETVLVNGATGASGLLAVQIAKHMGAKKVIATGRNRPALESLKAIGADIVIPLTENASELESAFKEQFTNGVDVVLDYLWGKTAELLLFAATKYGREAVPLRFVQIGSISGAIISLPGAGLRASAITLMGSGIGSVAPRRLIGVIAEVLQAAVPAKLEIATRAAPLSGLAETWTVEDSKTRIVFKTT